MIQQIIPTSNNSVFDIWYFCWTDYTFLKSFIVSSIFPFIFIWFIAIKQFGIKDIENTENVTLFNWDRETSNYHKLRSKVFSKLINNNKRDKSLRKWNLPDIKMHVLSSVALSLWLISFIFFCSNPSIYRAIIAGFFLHPLVGVGHNFLHQADNKGWFGIETYWRYVINLSLYDLYEFRVHHAISHHTYINLDCDLEVSALEPIINFMTNAATNYILVYLYAPIFYFFLPFLLWLQRMINDIFIERKFVFIHHIPFIQLLTLSYFNNEISWRLLGIYYIMHGVTSIIVTIVSFPIHRSDYCWTEGDKNGTKDFVKHVLMSTVDYYVDCGIIASLFGFEMFNDHRAHHLLPTLDASKIEQIRPLIIEYCKKDELKKEFRQDGYDLGQLLVGMLRNWYRVYQL